MAASGWYCITDFHDDPRVSLEAAHQSVFQSGQYGDHFFSDLRANFFRMPLGVQLICGVGAAFRMVDLTTRWVGRGCRGPRSIEEAVCLAGESGTHSILDVQRCGSAPDFGVAYPLSFARRTELFGTDKPTIEDWEQAGWLSPVRFTQRWNAVYFTVYENQSASKIGFVGCTGD